MDAAEASNIEALKRGSVEAEKRLIVNRES